MKIKLISAGSSKLEVIKIIKETIQFSLKDCKDLVDNAPIVFEANISENEFVNMQKRIREAGGIIEKDGAFETIDFNQNKPFISQNNNPEKQKLKLISIMSNSKIQTIKLLKDSINMSLKRGKDIVDRVPVTFIANISESNFNKLKDELLKIGSVIMLDTSPFSPDFEEEILDGNGEIVEPKPLIKVDAPEVGIAPVKTTELKNPSQNKIEIKQNIEPVIERKTEEIVKNQESEKRNIKSEPKMEITQKRFIIPQTPEENLAPTFDKINYNKAIKAGVITAFVSLMVCLITSRYIYHLSIYELIIIGVVIGYVMQKKGQGTNAMFGKAAAIITFITGICLMVLFNFIAFESIYIRGFIFTFFRVPTLLSFAAAMFLSYKLAFKEPQKPTNF